MIIIEYFLKLFHETYDVFVIAVCNLAYTLTSN